MSTPFEDQHSLWTYDDRAEWTDRNIVPDRLLLTGLAKESAMSGANHLADIYKGDTFEVRDIHENTVHVAGPARERLAAVHAPRRRKLGTRGD